mmetsp:Transcript_34727/g.86650  ORF Transcript_34727/g.86650 Transcript_34727/m.86650 type:complete len:236 (+) Transcript_34727:403-1110(+)
MSDPASVATPPRQPPRMHTAAAASGQSSGCSLRDHRELEARLLAGELLVNAAEGVELVLDVGRLLGVQVDFKQLRAVGAVARVLAHDLGRVDEILQDGVVHGGERAGHGPLLRQRAARLGLLPLDPALCDHDDMLARELLLELAHQPGLDLVRQLEQAVGHKQHHRLAPSNVDLLSGDDVELLQLGLQIRAVRLKVEQRLRHLHLEGVRRRSALILHDLVERGHVDEDGTRRSQF